MVLVTGGTGTMGSVLVTKLAQAGEKMRILTLPNDPHVHRVGDVNADMRYGNISNAGDVRGLCDGVTTVYHLAAIIIAFDDLLYDKINVQGTLNIVNEAKRAGVRHFIYVSSASVVYPQPTAYSNSKRTGEEMVKNSGLHFTIVRPTLVYDKIGSLEFDIFLDYLTAFAVIPFIGKGTAIKRPVFVDDINNALVALNGNKKAYNKMYNFSGAEAISIRDFARLCLRLMGRKKLFILLPVWLCHALSAVLGLLMKRPPLRWPVIAGMTQDADLDPSSAIRDLGYKPARVSDKLPECFPRTSQKK
ncbi:MAG: NAD-dependent epimerase/dehydratase family protein [Chitinivibrionales bacterium]|nr:NAD-dependent epimerase/dehydratase family protein [Chitinivibrionales bacterium]